MNLNSVLFVSISQKILSINNYWIKSNKFWINKIMQVSIFVIAPHFTPKSCIEMAHLVNMWNNKNLDILLKTLLAYISLKSKRFVWICKQFIIIE